MADFQVTLTYQEITPANQPPRETDLLFYDMAKRRMCRGWVTYEGQTILIGGQWRPTHYAEHEGKLAQAAELAALVAVPPTPHAFATISEKYVVLQRNTATKEERAVAKYNKEEYARNAYSHWLRNKFPNCEYTFMLNTNHR